MGDRNQRRWVGSLRDALPAPYLEAGARDWGSGQDLRSLFPGAEWVGADLAPGPGVDVVVDLAAPFEAVDRSLGGRRFGTVLCLSVLEHCARPFEVAANLTRLLAPGGRLAVSVPFAWKVHGFPADYWRFTPDGVRLLFPGIDFGGVPALATTDRSGGMGSSSTPANSGSGCWRSSSSPR